MELCSDSKMLFWVTNGFNSGNIACKIKRRIVSLQYWVYMWLWNDRAKLLFNAVASCDFKENYGV